MIQDHASTDRRYVLLFNYFIIMSSTYKPKPFYNRSRMSRHNTIIKKFDLYIVKYYPFSDDSGDAMNEHVGYNAKLLHII